ncbi:cell division protein FtsX [Pontibacter burrus]|uniref:Cell division protein FtsX n=1 Tax=Pontibacter burrus TaxID=2704466 RepID=A0A6B3LVB5_9BACT|nr:permease-like cell division protein FtsX [Pontibacter burrus]NEM97490.1 ABC transporter permease [Pontibacter burrus]
MAKQHKSIKKKKLGNYPHTMVVFSISLALFVIGLFGLLLIHANRLSEQVKESIEMQLYLDRNLTQKQLADIKKTLAAKDYVAIKSDTAQVRFVSKEKGAEEFIGKSGEDFTSFLGENPLRDAYVINIRAESTTPAQMKGIQNDLEGIKGVFEVQYVEVGFIESINSNIQKISIILLGFAIILILVVIILINNTIKLALYSQRFLIRSMQLVGATGFFIQRPFLNRAAWQGVMSGIIASALLFALMQYAYTQIEELKELQNEEQTYILMGALLVIGCIIGFLSSYRAVRKYLRLSLDELY